MELGKKISTLRIEKGLNQRELASHLGVSNGTIGMWETGKRQPDLETLIKISTFFNVSTDYLLETTTSISNITDHNATNTHFSDSLSPALREKLISVFSALNEDNQDIIIGEMKKLIKEQNLGQTSYPTSVNEEGHLEAK